jgi:hypothetical protein
VAEAVPYRSPVSTAPERPGTVFAVETVTDTSGDQPKVVLRGVCGAASGTAVIPAPPTPRITPTAPTRASTGAKAKDEAVLTGPFPAGTTVEFWYQFTEFADPGAAPGDLGCAAPDPRGMEGATRIGATILEQELDAGDTANVSSPEFTSDEPGCTWIKEIAWAPGGGPDGDVLAEGRFDTLSERTVWRRPPTTPEEPALPLTGANTLLWAGAAAGLLAAASALARGGLGDGHAVFGGPLGLPGEGVGVLGGEELELLGHPGGRVPWHGVRPYRSGQVHLGRLPQQPQIIGVLVWVVSGRQQAQRGLRLGHGSPDSSSSAAAARPAAVST